MIIGFKAKMKKNVFVHLKISCDTKNNFITRRNVFQQYTIMPTFSLSEE